MRIYFYPECNFNINKASVCDCGSLAEWFDSQHKNPDDYEIVGKDGEYHGSDYDGEVCAIYPKIMGGKKKGKNILTAVVGLALVLATGGTTAALFANMGGLHMAHALGAGLLLSGGGALLMGKMKMPSMDLSSDSATKENYQWNVGNLSTSRGVKGVTFGSNVIPEGELLAYRTYGTNSITKVVRNSKEAGWYRNGDYNSYYTKKKPKVLAGYKYLSGFAEYASRNNDSSDYLEVLIGAGEGELDSITDIKINDIPVADLEMTQDVDYAIRLGSNNQTALKQTNLDSQAGYQSIGQTVPVKLNGSVTPLLITTPSACDSCCIAFQVPNWYMYDTSSGAKNSAFIKLKIGYRTSGSSGSYTYLTKTGVEEIDNTTALKSDSAFYFQVVIKFPSNGTYQISIENDSAELNNTKGLLSAAEYSGSALPDKAAINMSVDNIACYNNKEQTYPNTALIWLRIPASQTLNGSMPKVTWRQTRANIYAYNGSSYVTKPADNLAWAIYDIIAQVRKDGNTYHNEGEDVSNIDFDKFVDFASFCDSIGAKGNWFLNKLDTSWSNAMSVATSCRAFIGLRSGKVCPYWDAPTEMTQIFTVGNYEDMSGVITAKKDRAKAIEATFNNEEEKFASRTVRVEIDNDHSAEAVSMTFAGLSNPVNVSKQAHYILRRNKYLVQSVKFTADIDSIVCELNDVIGVQCDLTEYGVGGRIFKVENNVISLDAPVTLTSGNSYALLVRHTDGTLERNTPVETNGTFTQLTFNSAWSKPVLKGDVYSFGIANSEVRKYRVTGITRTNDLKAQIEAIEYNENIYDELAVAPYTYTNPNAGINNVTTTYTPEAVELAWDANNNTSYVNVYVDGVFYGRYQNGAQIPNINSEQLVEMFPVNEYGEEDTPVVKTISNNLPTPSTPPVPVVQSTTTGCVAEFDGIPKDENIVWLIIKESENELGRVNILGEYMSVSIQLTSGTHTLSAYFVNQFSKSSQARTFTATPLNDITANNISATALAMPTGSILRLSAKNCTTASIAETNGVKDVSGNGNHGRAVNGGVQVVHDDELGDCFSFPTTSSRGLTMPNLPIHKKGISYSFAVKDAVAKPSSDTTSIQLIRHLDNLSPQSYLIIVFSSGLSRFSALLKDGSASRNDTNYSFPLGFNWNKKHTFGVSVSEANGCKLFVDGELVETNSTAKFPADLTSISTLTINNSNSYQMKMADIRIYDRELTDNEFKTIHMFPDDVTFGQLTADLIGANIIKASNLITTENLITSTAQIKDAIITDAKISGTIKANHIDASSLTISNIGGYNSMISSVNQTAQGYATDAANAIDVGGRNLARGTAEMKQGSGGWSNGNWRKSGTGTVTFNYSISDSPIKSLVTKGVKIDLTAEQNSCGFCQDTVNLEAGNITLSAWVKGTATARLLMQPFYKTGSSGFKTLTLDGTWQHLTVTVNIPSADTYNLGYFYLRRENDTAAGALTCQIIGVKEEYGNKATTWTPAPEDVDADATEKANTAKTEAIADSKSYADIELAKKMSIAAYCAANDTTKIDGGTIYTNSLLASSINVSSWRPQGCMIWLSAKGVYSATMVNGGRIPDISGFGRNFVLTGSNWGRLNNSNGWKFYSSSNNGNVMSIADSKTLTVSAGYFSLFLNLHLVDSDFSKQPIIFDFRNSSSNANRILGYFNSSGQLIVQSWNTGGNATTCSSGITLSRAKWYDIAVVVNSTTKLTIYAGERGQTMTASSQFTIGTRGELSANQITFFNNYANTANRSFYGYMGNIQVWGGTRLTATQIATLHLMGDDPDMGGGMISADRIQTDAIKSRNYAYSSGLYSTAGTFLDLANGQIISKNFSIDSIGNATFKGTLSGATGSFTGSVTASSGKIGPLTIDNSYGLSNLTTGTYGKNGINLYYNSIESYQSGRDISNNFTLGYGKISSSDSGKEFGFGDYFDPTTANPLCLIGEYYNNQVSPRTDYTFPILKIEPYATTHYGLYIKGKARIQSGEVTSDESVKKDFQEVSTLDKLKKLRVCAWRFDEEKLVEKDNEFIDAENIKIEAENKIIDAENAEIEKENEKRKNRKDGETVELLPLKEHKKLREHRIADKNTNHPLNIGCMAGEFNQVFGTNDGSKEALNITDTIGVCMRAIQELAAEVDELKAKLKTEEKQEEPNNEK